MLWQLDWCQSQICVNTLTPGGPSSPFSPLSPSNPGGPRSPWSKTVDCTFSPIMFVKVLLPSISLYIDSKNATNLVWMLKPRHAGQDWLFCPITLLYSLDFPSIYWKIVKRIRKKSKKPTSKLSPGLLWNLYIRGVLGFEAHSPAGGDNMHWCENHAHYWCCGIKQKCHIHGCIASTQPTRSPLAPGSPRPPFKREIYQRLFRIPVSRSGFKTLTPD